MLTVSNSQVCIAIHLNDETAQRFESIAPTGTGRNLIFAFFAAATRTLRS